MQMCSISKEVLKEHSVLKGKVPDYFQRINKQRALVIKHPILNGQIGYITAMQCDTGNVLALFPYCKSYGYVFELKWGSYKVLPREDISGEEDVI